ncbi:7,8-didemethyl-8-hydroxy-5-deazariboflavin synthase CofG [Microbacterium halophytorum]|uniref:7,8-didemethyl-8-hydroxy-5-deazariboflavin synthase CofG n=1 Tax=Microbacterium halophytorum TaxID=2067568 RepID=UPI000CFBC308|nr:7,8-didemethyl-8-hydroxy-5-deazariboflavin synthase CofG [Microbacterium halophytorum]
MPQLEKTAPAVTDALRRAEARERLTAGDAEALLAARGDELERVLDLASRTRDEGLLTAGRPGIITYSRKVFIPLTTLCRDRCHYCVFVDTPGQLLKKHKPAFMSPQQVLQVARRGAAMGCKEALLTLGDRPEDRWPEARAWLDAHGFASTLEYVGAMARMITAETGLLAHLNPGVMRPDELEALRPTAPSMGVMLETTSRHVYETPGEVHYGSPDKDPDVRLKLIDDAGRAKIPFTTGILVGIGEAERDRAESLVALRDAAERHGHIQEVIVQNFRAKPRTAAQQAPDAQLLEYVAAVAVARLVLGPTMRVQVPPNLQDLTELGLLVRAGVDDWGGVSPLTADHVNPERPWPHLDDLARLTAELGFTLRERLTAHPEYVRDDAWIAPEMRGPLLALAEPETFLAVEGAVPVGASPAPRGAENLGGATRQGAPRAGSGASTGTEGPEHRRRVAAQNADVGEERAAEGTTERDGGREASTALRAGDGSPSTAPADVPPLVSSGSTGLIAAVIDRAAQDPGSLDDAEWATLLTATGDDLEAMVRTADDVRRYTVGEAIGISANRNIASTAFRSSGAGPATLRAGGMSAAGEAYGVAELADAARDAWDLGLGEICVQGLVHPDEPAEAYLDIARTIVHAAPGIHLHAYRPQDVRDLAGRSGLDVDGALAAMRGAGVASVPGTGVKVLSERVRRLVAPDDLPVDAWVETISAAHAAGFRSTSVMFYGHAESAAERVAHLRELIRIQRTTGGFTEFVPIALPGASGGVPLVADRAPLDEHRAMVAVSRLMLSEDIPHIQVPWPRHDAATTAELLASGGDDLGGTLLDGRLLPASGIEAGAELPLDAARRVAGRLFRPLRLRTTTYGEPSAERRAAAEAGARGSGAAATRAA